MATETETQDVAAESPQPLQPIIIKKKKAHHGHHGGAWKVAYADFVTAMMALFIVLWLLSSSEQNKKAIGSYFRDPSGKGKELGTGLAGVGDSLSVRKEDLSNLKDTLKRAVKSMPSMEKIAEQVSIMITGEGLRVEMVEGSKSTFFETGSARPSAACVEFLTRLAQELGQMSNRIVIEGHTDSVPYGTGNAYGNWELSADRANSARRILAEAGMKPNQIAQVRGFADQNLRKPESPTDPGNRRISLIVQYGTGGTTLEVAGLGKGEEQKHTVDASAASHDKPAPASGGHGAPAAHKPAH